MIGEYSFSGKPLITEEDINSVVNILQSGKLCTGEKVREFEDALSSYTGAKYTSAVSNATSGLYLSLICYGIKKDDEVITTPLTFAGTANAIAATGAKPVFVDIDPDTFNLNVHLIEEVITEKTKAILIVDYAGEPCDLDMLNNISKKYKIPIIEDAAHALSSSYKGKMIGNCIEYGTTVFSFHPVKPITTGIGGAIQTNDKLIDNKLKLLIDQGLIRRQFNDPEKRFEHIDIGLNYRMSDIHAALGVSQLKRIDIMSLNREHIVQEYKKNLDKYAFIKFQKNTKSNHSSKHIFPIIFEDIDLKEYVKNHLISKEIAVNYHYKPLHKNKLFKSNKELSVMDYYEKRMMSLPLHSGMKYEDACYVMKNIDESIDRFYSMKYKTKGND